MRHAFPTALIAGALIAALPLAPSSRGLLAQGVTAATIHGTVRATDGTDVDGTEVVVLNTSTGYMAQVEVRNGGFFVAGLEAGGPYTVTAQRFGFHPEERQESSLEVGETLELDFEMRPEAISL
ncbi:MAG TPA: carboxypeptidase-like regulatory domain-containing protein, partial [Gemmatimonadota bacterium]|nr:carboxypeptidase-like regulatory domain-containing protein [Gemmatimonadota bacterium]